MLDVTEAVLLADFVTLRSDWRNIRRERDLAGRVNALRRVGNGPGHRRPRRYYAVTRLAATAIQSSSEAVVYGRLKSNLP
jgi:hypothetical protein